jgi:hypothetical protein
MGASNCTFNAAIVALFTAIYVDSPAAVVVANAKAAIATGPSPAGPCGPVGPSSPLGPEDPEGMAAISACKAVRVAPTSIGNVELFMNKLSLITLLQLMLVKPVVVGCAVSSNPNKLIYVI